MKRSVEYLDSLTYHVPPIAQGQIVERAYAYGEDGELILRVTDHSDRSVSFAVAEGYDGIEPWNGEPGCDFDAVEVV
jgi:hypothetical protein